MRPNFNTLSSWRCIFLYDYVFLGGGSGRWLNTVVSLEWMRGLWLLTHNVSLNMALRKGRSLRSSRRRRRAVKRSDPTTRRWAELITFHRACVYPRETEGEGKWGRETERTSTWVMTESKCANVFIYVTGNGEGKDEGGNRLKKRGN